jgi:hypothetical protein
VYSRTKTQVNTCTRRTVGITHARTLTNIIRLSTGGKFYNARVYADMHIIHRFYYYYDESL